MASKLVVLSHREPYHEVQTPEGPALRRKTNGVFTTLDAVMRQRQGTWIAWREREPDKPFEPHIRVPDEAGVEGYTVRRLGLDPDQARLFYYEFTSSAIWPVLFSFLDRARFTEPSWEAYQRVNQLFADAACEEAAPGAIIWVNDFHLMLTPKLIKAKRPDVTIALFLHTTFPPPDIFGVLPWRHALLDGLLHLDLAGFHIPLYVKNFADTAERFVGARPTAVVGTHLLQQGPAVAVANYLLSLRYQEHEVALGAYPVGVDARYFAEVAADPETHRRRDEIRQRSGAKRLILSAERLDYVKGVLERLECFERLLERHPEQHGEVSFVQIAVPTRTGMEEFQEMRRQAEEAVGRINGRFGTMSWQPVIHFYTSFERTELIAFYEAADIVWVTPLRDGLNLVAKEYIASRESGDGVVILSEFAGAAAELDDVILTNPYSPDQMDRALQRALTMPEAERRARMARMREWVSTHDIHDWSSRFLRDVERVRAARDLAGLAE